MKRHVINSWLKNPFNDQISLMEEPISDQLPPPDPSAEPVDPNTQTDQEPMPGAGPVESEPMPEETPPMEPTDMEPEIDFDMEKIDYMDLGLKQKHDEMMDKLLEMRDMPNLSPGEYKFIEDNIQVLTLLRDVDFNSAQKKIYKQLKDQFGSIAEPAESPDQSMEPTGNDQETEPMINAAPDIKNQQNMSQTFQPENYEIDNKNLKNVLFKEENELGDISGTEVVSIISTEIESYEEIKRAFLKLPSFYAMKADLFRKMVSALSNGIQIGSGGTTEDVFIPLAEGGVGLKLCTRCYVDFGNIEIGKWALRFNDPEKYLGEDELEKLNVSGSPEEKEILRKRVVIESIAEKFADKVYYVGIINPNDGSRREIGFNFSQLLREGWKNGVITVDFKASIGKGEAAINTEGELIDLEDIVLEYLRENSDELDEEGRPVKEHIELMRQKDGNLYITITGEEFDSFASESTSGLFYTTKQPEIDAGQLDTIQRCIPSITEMLLKKC